MSNLFVVAVVLGCRTKTPPATTPNAAVNPAAATRPDASTDPAADPSGPLSRIDLNTHLLKGQAEVAGEALVARSMQQPTLVSIPDSVPAHYEVHCQVTRLEGDGPAFLGLVVAGRPCLLVIDGSPEEGSLTGVSLIDGKPYQHPQYPARAYKGKLMTNGRPAQVACRIDGETLSVRVDQREVFRWKIDAQRLTVKPFFQTPRPGFLTLGSAKSLMRFEQLEIRAIAAAATSASRVDEPTKSQGGSETQRPARQVTSPDRPTKIATSKPNRPKQPASHQSGQVATDPAPPPPTKLAATSPADWAFASRRGALTTPLEEGQARLAMDGDHLVAQAAQAEKPVQLVYRPRLDGDFVLEAQVNLPPYEKTGTRLTGVARIGFRSTIDGVEQLWPLPSAAASAGSHRIRLQRAGKRFTLRVDGQTIPSSGEITTPGHFALQMSTPTQVRIEGIQLQSGDSGEKLVQRAAGQEQVGLRLVRSVGKWGLRSQGSSGPDQQLYNDVKLTPVDGGLQVSKSRISGEIRLVYLQDLMDDCLVTLRLELPERKVIGGRFPETTLAIAPVAAAGSMIELRVPRTTRLAEFQIQKSGELVVARLGPTESRTMRFTTPVRMFLRIENAVTLKIGEPRIETFGDSPTLVVGDEATPEIIKLPSTVEDTAVAAAGDVWLLHFRSLRKVGLFDVAQNKVTQFLALDDPQALIVGGLDRLYVLSPASNQITRYRLADLQPEASRKLDIPKLRAATMGFASQGPILVAGERSLMFLDGETLRPLEKNYQRTAGFSINSGGLAASADGRFFGVNGRGVGELLSYSITTSEVTVQRAGQRVLPSPLARWMHGDLPRKPNLEPLATEDVPLQLSTIPSTRDPLYLSSFSPSRGINSDDSATLISIHAGSQSRPLASWPREIDGAAARAAVTATNKVLPLYKRFLFHPPAGVVLTVSNQGDRLLKRRFDIKQLLDGSAIQEPLVTSLPSFTAVVGAPYRYQVAGWSPDGILKTELQSGPSGMQVTAAGEIRWTPADDAAGKSESVLLRIQNDSGKETFHSFVVHVKKPAGDAEPLAPVPLVDSDAPPIRIDVPAPFTRAVSCGGGRWLALHLKSLHKVAVVDLIEAKVTGYVDVKSDQPLLAGTRDALYLIDAESDEVEQWALPSLTSNWRHKLALGRAPLLVASGCDSEGPLLLVGLDGSLSFFDPATRQATRHSAGGTGSGPAPWQVSSLKASADARTFVVMRPFEARTGSFLLTRNSVGGYDAAGAKFHGNHTLVSADGRRLYAQPGVYATSGQKQILAYNMTRPQYVVPALQGPFYVRYRGREYGTSSQPASGPKVNIYLEDQERPLASFPADEVFEGQLLNADGGNPTNVGERVVALPFDGRLAILPHANNGVFVKRFDLDALLKEAAVDYLVVVSRPPRVARRGALYEYAMDVRSSTGDIQRKLESGPAGAALNAAGTFTWQVPPSGDAEQHVVIISLKGGNGRELFHTFSIDVPAQAARPSESSPPAKPIVPAGQPANPFRAWTERSSGRKVEAKLLGMTDGKVQLERQDGKRFVLPMNRLSDADQTFVRESIGTE